MKEALSRRERFVMAVKNRIPDRVPACPDLSNMIPARRTGKPFWDVYYFEHPPLWKAYLEAARFYGIDGRLIYGGLSFTADASYYRNLSIQTEILRRREDGMLVRSTYKTPKGDLYEEMFYPRDNPPVKTTGLIKDLPNDLPKLEYLFPGYVSYDSAMADAMRREAQEDAVLALFVAYPGFHYFNDLFDGGLQKAVEWYMDRPDLFEPIRQWIHKDSVRKAEMMIAYRPDVLYLGGSGTLTLSTPAWVREFSLPTIALITRMAKEAGVPTMLHSCGKSRLLVEMLANETDLDCINPLEIPPMGDVDLKEVKAAFGSRLALSGNIHTTEIMLRGTPTAVREACRQAIEDAGHNGGFLLMTGDQCGRDTPDENLFAFVEAAREFGQYR